MCDKNLLISNAFVDARAARARRGPVGRGAVSAGDELGYFGTTSFGRKACTRHRCGRREVGQQMDGESRMQRLSHFLSMSTQTPWCAAASCMLSLTERLQTGGRSGWRFGTRLSCLHCTDRKGHIGTRRRGRAVGSGVSAGARDDGGACARCDLKSLSGRMCHCLCAHDVLFIVMPSPRHPSSLSSREWHRYRVARTRRRGYEFPNIECLRGRAAHRHQPPPILLSQSKRILALFCLLGPAHLWSHDP